MQRGPGQAVLLARAQTSAGPILRGVRLCRDRNCRPPRIAPYTLAVRRAGPVQRFLLALPAVLCECRGKQLVEGLLRLAYTGSGLGCLHNSTIALRVIILRRERVESEEKEWMRGTNRSPPYWTFSTLQQETAGGQMPKDLIQDRKKINPGCDRLNHCKRYKLP